MPVEGVIGGGIRLTVAIPMNVSDIQASWEARRSEYPHFLPLKLGGQDHNIVIMRILAHAYITFITTTFFLKI